MPSITGTTSLYFTGHARRAAEHLLTAPAATRIQEVATISPITGHSQRDAALDLKIPDAEIARLSRGERVLFDVLTGLARPGYAVRIGKILADVDTRTFDAIIEALCLARGCTTADLVLGRRAS